MTYEQALSRLDELETLPPSLVIVAEAMMIGMMAERGLFEMENDNAK